MNKQRQIQLTSEEQAAFLQEGHKAALATLDKDGFPHAEAGATLDDVVQMTVYVHTMDDVLAIQEVRNEYWPSAPPVSATVQVARLVSDVVRLEV